MLCSISLESAFFTRVTLLSHQLYQLEPGFYLFHRTTLNSEMKNKVSLSSLTRVIRSVVLEPRDAFFVIGCFAVRGNQLHHGNATLNCSWKTLLMWAEPGWLTLVPGLSDHIAEFSSCLHRLLPHLLPFYSPFPYLSFPLRIVPLLFQAGGHKRRLNLGFFRCFSLFYIIVFLCFWCMIFVFC